MRPPLPFWNRQRVGTTGVYTETDSASVTVQGYRSGWPWEPQHSEIEPNPAWGDLQEDPASAAWDKLKDTTLEGEGRGTSLGTIARQVIMEERNQKPGWHHENTPWVSPVVQSLLCKHACLLLAPELFVNNLPLSKVQGQPALHLCGLWSLLFLTRQKN